MATALGATLITAGHQNLDTRVTQVLFCSILLDVHPSHAKITNGLSNAGMVRDQCLEMETLEYNLNHLINLTHVGHGQIRVVTRSL
jgi:hypothetical protein